MKNSLKKLLSSFLLVAFCIPFLSSTQHITVTNTKTNILGVDDIITENYKVKQSQGNGVMTVAEFKAQEGLSAVLKNFDFDARCSIESFLMTVVPKNGDPIDATNKGGKFGKTTKKLIKTVKSGDIVYIDNIKCRCPGDPAARKINSLVIKIK